MSILNAIYNSAIEHPERLPIFIGFLGGGLIWAVICFFDKRRDAGFEKFAAGLGLPLEKRPSDDGFFKDAVLPFFSFYEECSARNLLLLDGFQGGTLRFFDYIAVKRKFKGFYTIAFFDAGKAVFPDFELRPAKDGLQDYIMFNFLDKPKNNGTLLPEFPEFSKTYRLVTGESEERIRAFLNSEAVDLLVQNRDLKVVSKGRYLMIYGQNGKVRAKRLPGFLEYSKELVSVMVRNGTPPRLL